MRTVVLQTMRRRGTRITDIVVLLVDAVEGPLEQTLESLKAIRDHRTPFVVAISKIDKAGADVERVKQTLYQDLKVPLAIHRPRKGSLTKTSFRLTAKSLPAVESCSCRVMLTLKASRVATRFIHSSL